MSFGNWTGRQWTVTCSRVPHIAAGNKLEFIDGTSKQVKNNSSNLVWSAGFSYASDKAGVPGDLNDPDGIKHIITRTPATASTPAKLECKPKSNVGSSWTAQEG